MRIVVGWRRDHAGTQPLNMNMGPSFANEFLITLKVDCPSEGEPNAEGWMGGDVR